MSYKTYKVEVYDDGSENWYLNGKRHRENGPAIEFANGEKNWYLNNQLHREDGPAIEYAGGSKSWWLNGKRHREDGPAVECANGTKYWYLGDRYLTEVEFNRQTNQQSYNGTEIVVDGKKYKLAEVSYVL